MGLHEAFPQFFRVFLQLLDMGKSNAAEAAELLHVLSTQGYSSISQQLSAACSHTSAALILQGPFQVSGHRQEQHSGGK